MGILTSIIPFKGGIPLVINVCLQPEVWSNWLAFRPLLCLASNQPGLALEVQHRPGSAGLWGLRRVDRGEASGGVRQDVEVGRGWGTHGCWSRVHVDLRNML